MSSARRAGKGGRHGQSDATSVAGVATTALAGAGAALAQACEAAGLGNVLTVKPEDEESFVFKMVFTPEQQQAFACDGAFYEGVTKRIDTSEAKIMFIYGNSGPWYSLRMHVAFRYRGVFSPRRYKGVLTYTHR